MRSHRHLSLRAAGRSLRRLWSGAPAQPAAGPGARPRVLWITSEYHPRIGGLEALTADTLDALAPHAALGLITDAGQHPRPGQSLTHLGGLRLKGSRTAAEFEAGAEALTGLCRNFAPNAIHFASAGLACYAGRLAGLAPLFCTVHCKDLTAPWQTVPGRDAMAAIAEGLGLCRTVFCVSAYTQAHLRRLAPAARSHVLTPGLPAARRTHRGKPVFTPAGGVARILTVTRLIQRKGLRHLLDALALLETPFVWDIVGEGPAAAELDRWIDASPVGESVVRHGRLTDGQVALLFESCDLFALTPVEVRDGARIDAEGFGLVYLEAAAYGKPSVGSIHGGCSDAVADGLTGLLADPARPEAVAAALDRVLRSPSLRRKMGEAARARLMSDFRLEDRAFALMRAYAGQTV